MDKLLYDGRVDKSGDFYFNVNFAKNGTKVMLHMHNSVELKFIVDGKYRAIVSGREINCEKGDVLFVNSRVPHTYESVGNSINFVLVIDKELVDLVCPKGKSFPVKASMGKNFDKISAVLKETLDEWKNMDLYAKRGFVFRLLGALTQYNGLVDEEMVKEDVTVKIMEYIKENCEKDLTLDILAKEFGYTKNYFSNIINSNLRMGLRECVNRYRIEKAVKLINQEGGKTSLYSIAERCGYNSMNTFYRAYKKYAGEITPKDS